MESKILKGLAELGVFLGKKLDLLTASITAKETKNDVHVNMGEMTSAMMDFKKVSDTLSSLSSELKDSNERSSDELGELIQQTYVAVNDLKDAINGMVQSKDGKETEKIIRSIESLNQSIKQLKFPEISIPKNEKVDTKGLEKLLKELKQEISKKESTIDFSSVVDAIQKIRIDIPKTLKLDEMQMRELRSSGGGLMLGGTQQHGEYHTSMGDGRQTVTTPGTAVQLSTGQVCSRVDITAEHDNAGIIVAGSSTVVAAVATRRGKPLYQGDTITMYVNNLNKVYIDAEQATDGVTFIYYD